ncbi:hypothetical protein G195_003150 [Phytophthora kernoviae 00238/432]|uniref:Chromodomain-helicase-DNA-binding protein 9 n=1 Tax=Phytophthora kernoviae 00238/432 TaxID=1284355 RepID=A0A8J4WA65_9STRA|nr:hypothetical protein G195_003150 [Phytophthora kernoviae 00238/432]
MESNAPNEASAPDSKEETVALAPLPTPGTVGQASAGPKLEAKQVKVAESATDPNSPSNVAVKVQVNVESQVKTTRKNVDHDENGRRRKRRTSMKKIKYVEEDDISEEEEALIAEKKQRARQLDHQLRTDGGYPELDQIVGRCINASSGLVEYLCKFLGRSYLHLYWLTFDELELFIPEGYQKFHRVQVYDRKLRREGYQSLDEVDDLEANKLTVEKIMNHKVDPADHLDEQIEKRRRQLPFEPKFPRVTDYFLIDNTDALSERMMGIATKLMKEPGGDIFEHPVDVEEVPDYLNFITNPIDLDVRRVFHNCKVYNAEGSDIWRIADGLLRCFEKWLFDWLLCPSAWLKLPPTGDSKKDKEFQKDFRGQAEDSYDLWAPWQIGCCVCRNNDNSEELMLCDRHQSALATSTSGKKCCAKDRFCTLGYGHESECSRNMKAMGGAYGSAAYQKLHMAEQVKAQLFAFHCLLNNHTPDKDVLKQCGVYTNAYVTTKQYLKPKTSKEDEDEDYSEDDDSESSDDEADLDFPQRPALYPGILTLENDDEDENEDENEESGGHRKKLEVEVGEVLSSIVEHVALGYPTKLETRSAQVRFNSTFPPTPLCMLPTFTEYAVILRRSPFGLGMRLGVSNTNNVSVLGFQTLANGMLGPAEASRSIAIGDVLVAVNSISVAGLTFKDVVGLIGASSDNIRFHFHSARPAFMFPPYCQTKQVTMAQDGISDDVVSSDSKYAAYSFNKYKPMLKVGNAAPDVASSASTQTLMQHSNYITPSGPMQHFSSAGDNGDEFVPYEQSPTYKGGRTLRSYQVEGLNWMVSCIKAQRSCILADEMGLGKTVQIVSLIEHMKSEESIRGPYLIVVPLSTIQHWRREIESWTDLNVCVYHDIGDKTTKFTAKDMRSVIRDQEWYYPGLGNSIFKFHILLTTFETILADFEEFEHIHWRLIVVDEAHRLKGAGSRVLKQMRVLHVDRKVLLTGTPLQNNTQELWVLLNYLEPVKFASMEEFNKNFGRLHSQEQVVKLQQLLAPYILRRVKEDVEKSIPPKEETIISVELTTLQKQYYRAIYDKNKSFLYRGTKNGLPTLNNIQLQLRKCCNHPFLIKGVEKRELDELGSRPTPTQIMEKTIQCSGKMMLVSKLIPKLKRDGHKILIFSQFLKQLDLLERYCEANSFVFERLDGSTGGSMRQSAIDRFSRPHSKSFIFLLSTKAGGVGINLIAADTVIIFDSDWNPMNDLQAQSRCHRIGQKKSVQIYRLVTHNTESSQISKPSAEQLVELLKRGAYALMEDDDTASKEFAERDIETILKENARVLVVEGSTGELSVDDPNFWEKVLPGAVSVEMLSLKLEDGSAMSSRQSKIKFISNLDIALTSLIAEMSSGNISDDGGVGSRDIQHEYDIAIQVLSTVSSKYRDEFSNEQIDLVKGYLTKLEKSRKRFRCPSHFCHSCSLSSQQSSSTKKKKKKKKKDDMKVIVSCIHCSQAFHPDCIPSAEKFIRLSKSLMICANHLSGKKPIPGASAGKLSRPSHRAGATLAVAAAQQRLEVPEDIPLNEDDDLEEPMPSPSGKINGKRKRPASLTKANTTGPKKSKSVASKPSKPKLCALCSRGNVMGGGEGGQVLSTKKGARNGSVGESADTVGAATADMALEGPFIEAPVRLKYADKPQESVYVHLNCAVHSPEVYVKADGLIMNLPKAIKRGRQLKCTSCHKFGATVGCVVAKCRCNYHLRCAVESGGEIDGTTYALYCRPHAASRKEPVRVCTCDATDEDDPMLSLVCSSCSTKFHPKCVGMSERHAARKAKSWVCTVCDGSAVNKPKPVFDPKLKAPSASSTSRSSSKSSKDPASTTTKTESNGTAISKPTSAPKRKKPKNSRLTTPRNKSKAAGGTSHTQGISPHMDADSDSDVSTDE